MRIFIVHKIVFLSFLIASSSFDDSLHQSPEKASEVKRLCRDVDKMGDEGLIPPYKKAKHVLRKKKKKNLLLLLYRLIELDVKKTIQNMKDPAYVASNTSHDLSEHKKTLKMVKKVFENGIDGYCKNINQLAELYIKRLKRIQIYT